MCSGINTQCLQQQLRLGQEQRKVLSICQPLSNGGQCSWKEATGVCAKGVCMAGAVPLTPPQQQPYSFSGDDGGETAGGARNAAVADIDTRALGPTVPPGFLGTSHEWTRVSDLDDVAGWARVFKLLGPGAVLRIGGETQEELTDVPVLPHWRALQYLQQAAGARFIIGLPLVGNNATLTLGVADAARRYLPPASVLGLELGNEPTYWCMSAGGWDSRNIFTPGHDKLVSYFHTMANRVSGCDKLKPPARAPVLLGPAWGDLKAPSVMKAIAQQGSCYLKELTAHYYAPFQHPAFNIKAMLSPKVLAGALGQLAPLIADARQAGLPLRVSEANSIASGGIDGISNVHAAALWTVDTAFEFVRAGVSGLNLHWNMGTGDRPHPRGTFRNHYYEGVHTNFSVPGDPRSPTFPVPKPPFLGYLLFNRALAPAATDDTSAAPPGAPAALAAVSRFTNTSRACGPTVLKVWPVALRRPGTAAIAEVRVVVVNKGWAYDCELSLRLAGGAFGEARLQRLLPGGDRPADGGLASRQPTLAGQTLAPRDLRWAGSQVQERVQGRVSGSRAAAVTEYRVVVRRASALLLVAAPV